MDSTEIEALRAELAAAQRRVGELEADNRRVAETLTGAGIGTWRWSAATNVVEWDERMLKVYGQEKAPASYEDFLKLVHPDDLDRVQAAIGDAMSSGVYDNLLHRVLAHDGTIRVVQARGQVITDELGAPAELLGSSWDVTHEMELERDLRKSQERLSMALEATRLGTWRYELATGALEWDEGMLAVHGVSEAPTTGEASAKLIHPDDLHIAIDANTKLVETGVCVEPEFRVLGADGSYRWVLVRGRVERDDDGNAIALFGGTIDVTRLKELEEQLRRSQRFEAVGHLTAGIAHNFNNLLMAIIPNVGTALLDVPAGTSAYEALTDAEEGARRAAALIRPLMVYSRRNAGMVNEASDAADVVTRTMDLFAQGIDRKFELLTSVPKDLPPVRMEAAQLEQVLLNLVVNARDALNGAAAPRIKVALAPHKEPGTGRSSVRLTVTDNGGGIDPALVDRIFQPFVTSKGPELGTGLGLATVDALVRHVDGRVRVASSSAAGTSFEVDLPVSERPAATDDKAVHKAGDRSKRRLLIVDDEPLVRRTLTRLLESAGHEVVQAEDGASALEILSEQRGALDAYLVDHWMPKLNGRDLIQEAEQRGIDLPYLILSGDPSHAELKDFDGPKLRKPVLRDALLEAVDGLGR